MSEYFVHPLLICIVFSDTKAKKAISPEKVHELIAQLDPTDPHECAYLLAVTLGLRRGEICGLSWRDIDFERNIVDVSHSYDNLGNLKGTKTKAGMRLLPLSPVTRDALLKMKEAQAAQFAKTNSYRKPGEGYLAMSQMYEIFRPLRHYEADR